MGRQAAQTVLPVFLVPTGAPQPPLVDLHHRGGAVDQVHLVPYLALVRGQGVRRTSLASTAQKKVNIYVGQ